MNAEEMKQRILEVAGPDQADAIWSLWVEFVSAWFTERWEEALADARMLEPDDMERMWREEMSTSGTD